MVAHRERLLANAFDDLLGAARECQGASQADSSPCTVELRGCARKLHQVVAQFLCAGDVPRVCGLSPVEAALYRAALRYGSAGAEREPAALQTLIDIALALPPAAHPSLTR